MFIRWDLRPEVVLSGGGDTWGRGDSRVVVANFLDLSEFMSDHSCLVPLHVSVRSSRDVKNPFAPCHEPVIGTRDDFKGLHALKGALLVLARQLPVRCVWSYHRLCMMGGYVSACDIGALDWRN